VTATGEDSACAPVGVLMSELDLRVGSLVVYGGHGVGRVALARGAKPSAEPGRSVVIEFASGLSVTLPLERALLCLRPLAGEVEVELVREVLRAREIRIEDSWRARTKSTRTKLVAGEVVALAEVVRDGAARQRGFTDGQTLSSHEREQYLKARRLLAAELAAATGDDEAGADAWIETQLDWIAAP
jgi:RNA polymerase-interacting CarD/CdnL/TRCF family regulator